MNIKLKPKEELILETDIEFVKVNVDGEGIITLEHLDFKITNDMQP